MKSTTFRTENKFHGQNSTPSDLGFDDPLTMNSDYLTNWDSSDGSGYDPRF
jgi:hypothetical protein